MESTSHTITTADEKIGQPTSGFVRFISRCLDPRLLAGPVILLAAARGADSLAGALGWTLLVMVIAVLPAAGLIAWGAKRGTFSDSDVLEQNQRSKVYLVGSISILACLLVIVLLQAPSPLVALLSAMVANSALASILNLRWKVSVHTGTSAGVAISLLWLVGPLAFPALGLIPAVGWSRLALRRHTLGEVMVGGIGGCVTTALVFWLMSPG